MTRDEFIDGYMRRSGLPVEYRTPDGFVVPGSMRKVALPCACGEDVCEGWAMIGEMFAAEHRRQQQAD
jgi:hypothetical protein